MDDLLKIKESNPIKLPKGTKFSAFIERIKARKQMKTTYDIDKDKEFKETLLIDEVLEAENE